MIIRHFLTFNNRLRNSGEQAVHVLFTSPYYTSPSKSHFGKYNEILSLRIHTIVRVPKPDSSSCQLFISPLPHPDPLSLFELPSIYTSPFHVLTPRETGTTGDSSYGTLPNVLIRLYTRSGVYAVATVLSEESHTQYCRAEVMRLTVKVWRNDAE